ncbi:hypothetical protein EE612_035147 [Oryza sativa]|nr:hypothetical protein EE612_035147 [Oryza sativa]
MDDLTARPLLDSVVISATGEIERRRERFSARSLVAWQVGALGDKVEIGVFADDMRSAFHIRRADIQFTKFHPEVFFITCSNQSDRDAILRQPRLTAPSGRVYLFRPWDESLHGIPARYRYRARLCIEGVPMHGRTDEAAAKVIGRKCAIHYVEEYSRRGNYNRTYDMWVWTGEPRAIPRGGTFAITDADEEGLPTDIPLPELDPLRNPLPSEPKKGWTYNVLVHVDTLEDLHTRKARAYKWDYEVQDDGIRFKEYPLPCRAEPDLARGPTMTMMIERTTPKAVIEAVHSGTGSVAALPVGIVSQTGAMASAATRKEGEDRETRNGMTTEAAPTILPSSAPLLAEKGRSAAGGGVGGGEALRLYYKRRILRMLREELQLLQDVSDDDGFFKVIAKFNVPLKTAESGENYDRWKRRMAELQEARG